MEPNWANLEELPLSLILDKLEEGIDHVWFGAVCKSWRSVAKLNHQNHQFRTNMLPMLMIPTMGCDNNNRIIKKRLYGILSETVYPFQVYLSRSHRCCGSTHGWLALVGDNDINDPIITLFNPFKKHIAPISLPPLKSVRKVTLSTDPITSPNDYVVAAIYRYGLLAYIRAGQTFWTFIDTNDSGFTDVVFYKGDLVFAVNQRNVIVSFNPCYLDEDDSFGNEKITPRIVLEAGLSAFGFPEFYLVKSLTGDLWMVRMRRLWNQFDVFKLEPDAQSAKLEQMPRLESLEDNVLFLGSSDSVSVSASYFSMSLQKDSIYLSDDLNIYDMNDGTFPNPRHCPISFKQMPLPFWILPHFQWD